MRLFDRVSMVEEAFDDMRALVVWRVHMMTGIILVFTEPPNIHVGDSVSLAVEKTEGA